MYIIKTDLKSLSTKSWIKSFFGSTNIVGLFEPALVCSCSLVSTSLCKDSIDLLLNDGIPHDVFSVLHYLIHISTSASLIMCQAGFLTYTVFTRSPKTSTSATLTFIYKAKNNNNNTRNIDNKRH